MSTAVTETLFASTTPGLEPVLAAEARARGWKVSPASGGVLIEGAPGLHQDANLWLRTANSISVCLRGLDASSPHTLEVGLRQVSLQPFRAPAVPVRLKVVAQGSRVTAGAKLDALAHAALRLVPDKSESIEGALELQLRVEGARAELRIDSTGTPLYMRGYRQEVSRAPLRETLAAGILELAGYRGQEPLWDPMCGSGTFLIEAALLALNRAPGAGRPFAFERWPSHSPDAWNERLAEARAAEKSHSPPLRGTDLNSGSLGTARRNARRAKVGERLVLERQDATALVAPAGGAGPGLVVANLPYGVRVGERAELPALYRAFGKRLTTALPGWRFALLVASAEAEGWLGLAREKSVALSNGGIPCSLLVGRLG